MLPPAVCTICGDDEEEEEAAEEEEEAEVAPTAEGTGAVGRTTMKPPEAAGVTLVVPSALVISCA